MNDTYTPEEDNYNSEVLTQQIWTLLSKATPEGITRLKRAFRLGYVDGSALFLEKYKGQRGDKPVERYCGCFIAHLTGSRAFYFTRKRESIVTDLIIPWRLEAAKVSNQPLQVYNNTSDCLELENYIYRVRPEDTIKNNNRLAWIYSKIEEWEKNNGV